MTENKCYDVCCDHCIEDAYELIEVLIRDIQLLASEVVRLRYLLSWHLPEHTGEMVRCESRSDLRGSYYHYPTYQDYVSKYCDGHDPFDCELYCNHMARLAKGEKSADEFRSLTL
jgi:hypothetical protein